MSSKYTSTLSAVSPRPFLRRFGLLRDLLEHPFGDGDKPHVAEQGQESDGERVEISRDEPHRCIKRRMPRHVLIPQIEPHWE